MKVLTLSVSVVAGAILLLMVPGMAIADHKQYDPSPCIAVPPNDCDQGDKKPDSSGGSDIPDEGSDDVSCDVAPCWENPYADEDDCDHPDNDGKNCYNYPRGEGYNCRDDWRVC